MSRFLKLLRPSLLTRVAIALAMVGLLPVGVLAFRLIGLNRDAMESQVELTHTRAAATIAKQIDAELAMLQGFANGLSANPAFADPRSPAVQDLLRYNLGAWSHLGVLAIAVVTPQGESVIMAQLPDEDSRQRVRETIALPVSETVILRSAEPLGKEPGGPVSEREMTIDLRVAASLPDARGFVWLIADGSLLRDTVAEPEQLGEEATVTLAHRSGFAILGTLDPYPEDVLRSAFNPNVEGVQSSFRTVDGDVIGAYAQVDSAPWSVLSRQQLDSAHAVANDMERESWLAVALVTLVVSLISTAAYVSVVRPIRQLAAAQRRLAGVGGAAAGNEIDQLRASFDAL
ncbi:MAG: cache domain-containing protein, partial [Acidobacteriota bacterium]|nr:cache domain-containing protein [Acidobacteriota bacterium]